MRRLARRSIRYHATMLATLVVLALAGAATAHASKGSHGPPNGKPGLGGNPGRGGGVASPIFDPILRRRDFSVGHAEVTESPLTTPAGQLELEVGAGNVSSGQADTLRARTMSLAPLGLSWGVAPRVDLRLSLDTYAIDRISSTTAAKAVQSSGFGDIHLRARTCLVGNDSSAVAVGFVIDARSPHTDPVTGSTRLDGGVIVPAAFDLPFDTSLGVMAEVDVRDDVGDDGRHAETVGSASLTHDLTHTLSAFAEFVSVTSAEAGVPWLGVTDAGVYWDVTPWLSAGAGGTLGVSDAPGDRGVFAGMSWHHRLR